MYPSNCTSIYVIYFSERERISLIQACPSVCPSTYKYFSETERSVLQCLLTSMEEYTERLEADYAEEKMKTEQLLYQLLPR